MLLGVDKVNLIGYSYGGLMVCYVVSVVLDKVVLVSLVVGVNWGSKVVDELWDVFFEGLVGEGVVGVVVNVFVNIIEIVFGLDLWDKFIDLIVVFNLLFMFGFVVFN